MHFHENARANRGHTDRPYNLGHNTLELGNILGKIPFTTSKAVLDI